MAKFNPDNYEQVEDRLKKFWKDNPEGRVQTFISKTNEEGTMVIIGCEIYKNQDDDRPVSTGYAQEYKGQGGFANTESWLENCETSAIGRALANWKYQGSNKSRPSAEEMSKTGVFDSKPAVEVTKADMRLKENKPDEQLLAESMKKFEKDIGYSNNSEQIKNIVKGFGLPEDVEKKVKVESFTQFVNSGYNKDIDTWDNDTIGEYLDLFEQLIPQFKQDEPSIEDVVGEVFTTAVAKVCPSCNNTEYIEDNREKKASDVKFANIPDFACSNYGQNNGCGWGGYIGSSKQDKAVPESWL